MNNTDWFGQKSVSINDIVELDYSQKSVEYSEEENLEYSKHIYFARENIIGGNFKIARKNLGKKKIKFLDDI